MRRYYTTLMRDTETRQHLVRMTHRFPVRLAAHDNRNQRSRIADFGFRIFFLYHRPSPFTPKVCSNQEPQSSKSAIRNSGSLIERISWFAVEAVKVFGFNEVVARTCDALQQRHDLSMRDCAALVF